MVETGTTSSIWERLTPERALELAEKTLLQIEEGTLSKEAYSGLVDRLIDFSDEGCHFQKMSGPEQIEEATPFPKNRIAHQRGLDQLSEAQRVAYLRRTADHQASRRADKRGPKARNRRRHG